MGENIQILLRIYYQPARAFSAALDHGNLVFAIAAALIAHVALYPVTWLAAVALLFVPAAVAIAAAWEGIGSTGVALRRDYAPMLTCVMFGWAAAHLPFALAALALRAQQPSDQLMMALQGTAVAYFLILAVFAIRTVSGASNLYAAGAAVAGAVAVGIGSFAWQFLQQFGYFLMSPMVLLWIYFVWRPDFSQFGQGLRTRQNFRRQLEAAALNPRDADAQYQLGLIYQQRRNYSEAIARFQKAVEIDPTDPDPHFQLGRIAREQGRHREALASFETCAKFNPKHSSHEIQRDLGATKFELGDAAAARPHLEAYVEGHEYNAEGQYWMGRVYRHLQCDAEARRAFETAVEAARTAPSHLRAKVSKWGRAAATELKR